MVSAIQLEEYGIQLTTGIQKKIKNFSYQKRGKNGVQLLSWSVIAVKAISKENV